MPALLPRLLMRGLGFAGLAMLVLTGQNALAQGFSHYYAPPHWKLANVNANGSIDTASAPASIALTGGNNLSGLPGTSTYTITAPAAGTISFDWAYHTKDFGSYYDPAGYILNGVQTQLTVNAFHGGGSQSGKASFTVAKGDILGFYVYTRENFDGAATITVSNFSAATSIPEAGTLVSLAGMLTTGMLVFSGLAAMRRRGRAHY